MWVLTFQVPSTSAVKVWRGCDHDDLNVVTDVLVELELFGEVLEVLPHHRIVHKVGVVFGDGEVTVAHHLLAGVDHSGTHHTRMAVLHLLGVPPQTTQFIRALKAHGFQSLVYTAFDGSQTAAPTSDDGYPFGHLFVISLSWVANTEAQTCCFGDYAFFVESELKWVSVFVSVECLLKVHLCSLGHICSFWHSLHSNLL